MVSDDLKRLDLLAKLAQLKAASGDVNLSSRVLLVLQEAAKPQAPPEVVASAKRLAAMVLELGVPRSQELSRLLQTVINGPPQAP
jgi:hypothetical protein